MQTNSGPEENCRTSIVTLKHMFKTLVSFGCDEHYIKGKLNTTLTENFDVVCWSLFFFFLLC